MPSIGFSLDFLNKFSLSDIESLANFSLSDIEMESFLFGWILWVPWFGSFGFQFYGLDLNFGVSGFHLWVLVVFNSGFGSLVFWLFFRVSLDPVERCIPVSGTRIGRHFKIHKKTRKK